MKIAVLKNNNMETNEALPSYPQTNRHSITSLILGILTVLALCGGMVPIPFTGFICFPTSFITAFFALIFGVISLNQLKQRNESGHPMAWTGVIIGGFIFFCMLCMVIAVVSLFVFAPNSVPPILNNYQL